MMKNDDDYHARRTAEEKQLAEKSADPAAAAAHMALARLHAARAANTPPEPKLRLVI